MADPIISLRGATKRYGERLAARVDLEIAPGAFVALVGASGCGKTTTLKMINGLSPADQGEVRVQGVSAADGGPALRRRIGYVFQDIGLFPHLTVGENIGVTPRLLGWPRARVAARVTELLGLVGLDPEMAGRAPAALSGGQRQRVGVARALAAEPAVMLMDEPFGALDPVTREQLGRDYCALHERLGLTTVMVTHDMTEALLLADRIVVMDKGHIVADDAPAALARGHADPVVRALMETPIRQAERLAEVLGHG